MDVSKDSKADGDSKNNGDSKDDGVPPWKLEMHQQNPEAFTERERERERQRERDRETER